MKRSCQICLCLIFFSENEKGNHKQTKICRNCETNYEIDEEGEMSVTSWTCDYCDIETLDERKLKEHELECKYFINEIAKASSFATQEKEIMLKNELKNESTYEMRQQRARNSGTKIGEYIQNLKESLTKYKVSLPKYTNYPYFRKKHGTIIANIFDENETKGNKNILIHEEEIYPIEIIKNELTNHSILSKKIKDIIIRERALDYKSAIDMWEELGYIGEAARVRKMQAKMGSVNVAQNVIQGDQVTKTEIKDSVLNRSNVGSSSSKMQELKDLTEMKKEGLIDDDEFKQMKKEILGK